MTADEKFMINHRFSSFWSVDTPEAKHQQTLFVGVSIYNKNTPIGPEPRLLGKERLIKWLHTKYNCGMW